MTRISEYTIEKVRYAADIIEVVSSYVDLKQRGKNFFGLCPFHKEKTPSFSVNPEKQIYKCFGCGVGGGSINFIMDIDNIEFIDAIQKLANMFNIKINFDNDNKQFKDLKTQLFSINNFALNYFKKNLNIGTGLKVREYLNQRGFTNQTIEEFGLGYVDNKSNTLLKLIQKEKFSSDSMKKSGLFYDGKSGYFDRFRSRLMFPIYDRNSNIIAFAGRVYNTDDPAKYINSPETLIYTKSKTLYGLNKTFNEIKKHNYIIIVEGYFDLIQLFQVGIKNVVAVSGTAFTDSHAAIIKRYTTNIFIAFDGDIAGKKASIKTGYILLKNSINPKIINTPNSMDPDDWVRQKGPNEFLNAIKKSESIIDFHYNQYNTINNVDKTTPEFINEVLSEIIQINDPINREISAKNLSEIVNISKESVFASLNALMEKKIKLTNIRNKDLPNETHSVNDIFDSKTLLEDDFIRLCLNKNFIVREFIFDTLDNNWLQSIVHKEIFDKLYIHLKSKNEPPINLIINETLNKETRKKIIDLTIKNEKFSPTLEMAKDCLIRLEKLFLKKQLHSMRKSLRDNDDEKLEEIQNISDLEKKIMKIDNKYS